MTLLEAPSDEKLSHVIETLLFCANLWARRGALLFYDMLQTLQGALLLCRVFLIGTIWYFWIYCD